MKGDKSKEGSRGGDVIGHTASGKPIYAGKSGASVGPQSVRQSREMNQAHHKATREMRDHSVQDHKDASKSHKEKSEGLLKQALASKDYPKREDLWKQAEHHHSFATAHEAQADRKAKSEGTHGWGWGSKKSLTSGDLMKGDINEG